MARLELIPEPMHSHLSNLPCPSFDTTPWATGPELAKRRVALVSTAGLHLRGDRPFAGLEGDYRVIPGKAATKDLVMTHVSTNFDRTGFVQDWNIVFPLDRLRELSREQFIGGVADFHYSFMGATDPVHMVSSAKKLAQLLKGDKVDAAFLIPV
jgi:D-proline reductase (dithiol) PrdB